MEKSTGLAITQETAQKIAVEQGTKNYDYVGGTPGLTIPPPTSEATNPYPIFVGRTEYLDQIPRGIPIYTEEEMMHKDYQAATGDTGKDQYGMHGWVVQGPPGSDPYEEWLKYQGTVEGLNPDIIPLPPEPLGNRVEASGSTRYINSTVNIESVNSVEDFEGAMSKAFTDVLSKAGIVSE